MAGRRPVIAAARKTYAALWAATAVGAAGAAAADVAELDVGAPHDDLQATIATAIGLLAGNALVALWPLAPAALWNDMPGVRTAGDVLVGGQLIGQGLIVGGAIGQQPGLRRYGRNAQFLLRAGWTQVDAVFGRHLRATALATALPTPMAPTASA